MHRLVHGRPRGEGPAAAAIAHGRGIRQAAGIDVAGTSGRRVPGRTRPPVSLSGRTRPPLIREMNK